MKQGYYYTISVLFFTGVLLAVFLSQTDVLAPVQIQQDRVASMDDFLSDLHRDMDRAAFIAGFRSLLAMEGNVADNGTYLDDTEAAFTEAFLNGTVNGVVEDVMTNATFSDYVQRVQYEASQLGMKLDIIILNISLYHITPWEVAVDYETRVSLNDTRDETRWQYDRSFSTRIEIFDLRDPMYSVETNNKVLNTIRVPSVFTEYIDDAGDANDTTVLVEFLEESYYSPSELSPNFLMRFEGNFSANEFGIESLVNLEKIDAQGLPIDGTRSVVDSLFFTTPGSADRCSVQNMPSYFKIDDARLQFYEINPEVDYSLCI